MGKERLTKLFTVLSLLVAVYMVSQSYLKEIRLKESMPFLTEGEEIEYFRLVDTEDKEITETDLQNGPALLYIFRMPCSTCNSNFKYWNRMSKILKKHNILSYGIIPGNASEMFTLAESRTVFFRLCTPCDLGKFKEAFRLKTDLSQTLLIDKGEVHKIKPAHLNGKTFRAFINEAKKLNKENNS